MKTNYIVIPVITLLTATFGGYLTDQGLAGWYQSINLPAWTPTGGFIGLVWTIIFLLSTISALIVWNSGEMGKRLWNIGLFFIINAFLNIFWVYLFFFKNMIGTAFLEAILLEISVLVLIVLIWPISKKASVLLWPYAGWVAFATYLTYVIQTLNQ